MLPASALLLLLGPDPTPTPAAVAPAHGWSWIDEITLPIVHFIAAHPRALLAFILSSIAINLLRWKYPLYRTRPRWARLVISLLDITAGNLWRLLIWLGARIGLVLKGPSEDDDPEQKP